MFRRTFLHQSSVFSASLLFPNVPGLVLKNDKTKDAFRHVTASSVFPDTSLPDQKRVPLGWKSMPVVAENPGVPATMLRFGKLEKKSLHFAGLPADYRGFGFQGRKSNQGLPARIGGRTR